ncbi:MAG TPA: glycine/betaine ABC transporter [Eubacteriaceae bacterium]|nr:glycine/betaine ABC transporter [Eubacteriaceae bacterium]
MLNLSSMLPVRIPIGGAIEAIIDFLTDNFRGFFRGISSVLEVALGGLENFLNFVPPIVLAIVLTLIAWKLATRGVAIFTFVGMVLIDHMELWGPAMSTLSMVLFATVISIIFGVPLGILTAKNKTVRKIITPILDFMQTMPAFVYLLPAVSFFGMGQVPGLFATVIFSIPPSIRLTSLGIQQVPEELVEAADAFGSTPKQKLFKVQIPLALSTIMPGINQTIMLSLSMVVISAMIGAGGLGREVLNGISRLWIDSAFEAGLAVVFLAMILDKLTQSVKKDQ